MKRIEELAKFIYPYRIIADIGCDHGYLIKVAFDKGLIDKAYAIDNKKGPLENAKCNLATYNNIIYSCSDGLSQVGQDTEVVIIAGMGGTSIVKILEKGIDKLQDIKRVIVEANRNTEQVRMFAINDNLKIVSEEIIEEDGIFYEIIVLEKGLMELNEQEVKFGPLLLKEKSEEFINKWQKQIDIYENKKSKSLDKEIKEIKEVLKHEN